MVLSTCCTLIWPIVSERVDCVRLPPISLIFTYKIDFEKEVYTSLWTVLLFIIRFELFCERKTINQPCGWAMSTKSAVRPLNFSMPHIMALSNISVRYWIINWRGLVQEKSVFFLLLLLFELCETDASEKCRMQLFAGVKVLVKCIRLYTEKIVLFCSFEHNYLLRRKLKRFLLQEDSALFLWKLSDKHDQIHNFQQPPLAESITSSPSFKRCKINRNYKFKSAIEHEKKVANERAVNS